MRETFPARGFMRFKIPIIPHEELSGMTKTAHTRGTKTWTRLRAGGIFCTSCSPREPWLTVRRGQQVWTGPSFWTMIGENLKTTKFDKNWRLLAQNDVWKFKIALLMQNERFAGCRKWLVETGGLLESNTLWGVGHVGWPSWWDKCNWNFWNSRFLDQFHQFKFVRSIFPT